MRLFLIWAFTLLLVIVWIFYIIISIHSKKFANFSTSMNKVLFVLFCVLLFLSISWYFVLGFGKLSWSSISDFFSWSSETKVDLKDLNIWDNTTY